MDRKIVYKETKSFLEGRKGSIFFILIGISFLVMIVGSIFGGSSVNQFEDILNGGDPLDIYTTTVSINYGKLIVTSLIRETLNAALIVTILQAFVTKGLVKLTDVTANLKKHWVAYLTIGFVMTGVTVVLTMITMMIPAADLLVSVLTTVVAVMFSFAYFTVRGNTFNDGIESIKESIRLTNGHKMNLFIIELRYLAMSLIPLFVIIISMTLFYSESTMYMGFLLLVFGIILLVVFLTYYGIFILTAPAVYYELLIADSVVDTEMEIIDVVENIIASEDDEN